MMLNKNKIIGKNEYIIILKIFASAVFIFFPIYLFSSLAPSNYTNYKVYQISNSPRPSYSKAPLNKRIEQTFIARGNILNSIKLYFITPEKPFGDVSLSISKDGQTIIEKKLESGKIESNQWTTISIDQKNLHRGEKYSLKIVSDSEQLYAALSEKNDELTFAECYVDGTKTDSSLISEFAFTYEYFTAGDIGVLFLLLVSILFFSVLCIYTIFNFESIYSLFCQNEKKSGLFPAIFFSAAMIFIENPLEKGKTAVTDFTRVFGQGFAAGYDPEKTIANFRMWHLGYGVIFMICWIFFCYWINQKRGKKAEEEVVIYFNKVISVGSVCLICYAISFFSKTDTGGNFFNYPLAATLFLSILILIYDFLKLHIHVTFNSYKAVLFSGLSLAFAISACINKDAGDGRLVFTTEVITTVIGLITLFLYRKKAFHSLGMLPILCSLFPILSSFFIELVNISNQYRIFIGRPRKWFIEYLSLYLFCCSIVLFIYQKRRIKVSNWERLSYPILIFGIACLSVQLPLDKVYKANIFESANYGVLINDFLQYKVIPVVEHYGGHMMLQVWEGILYGIINRDYEGAILSPYAVYILSVQSILFYSCLKTVLDKEHAFLITLLIPFYSNWEYYGVGFLVILALNNYERKGNRFSSFLLWLSMVWCAIYRVDLGFAFDIACVVTLIILCLIQKRLKLFTRFILSGIVTGIIGIGFWIGICIYKNINPWYRMKEFILISTSNQNHGYNGVGNPSLAVFSWSYIFIPLISICLIIILIFSKGILERIGTSKWIILLMFGFAYFANFPRGLTRHSLVEGLSYQIIFCAYLFIASSICLLKNNKKLFLPIFLIFILTDTLFKQDNIFSSFSILQNAGEKTESFSSTWSNNRFSIDKLSAKEYSIGEKPKTRWEEIDFGKVVFKRVTSSLENETEEYRRVMDLLLEKDETFVDFMNRTFVYPAINRKCPVYVAQSPIILSGEYAQEQFIAEIEKERDLIPVVIMPMKDSRNSISYDNLPNAYRYYKVSEYIYQNFRPLCTFGEVALWCRNERFEDLRKKLLLTETDNIPFITVGLECYHCEAEFDQSGILIRGTEKDPQIIGIEKLLDLSGESGSITIGIECISNKNGNIKLFYTSDFGEDFSEAKSVIKRVRKTSETVFFTISVTEYSKLRLDFPDDSSVRINSLSFCKTELPLISWGYDEGSIVYDELGNSTFVSFYSQLHNYNIQQLPEIWAEKDQKRSIENECIAEAEYFKEFYLFDNDLITAKNAGNYLSFTAEYAGLDYAKSYKDDDEFADASVLIGIYDGECFEELYRYNIKIHEGSHQYMIRISTDYNWYQRSVNAIKIVSDSEIHTDSVKVLAGD